MRTHIDRCATCRAALEQSRELMGLLELHFGQDEAMQRLAGRLKAESRPAPPRAQTLPFVRRFAAVAALVLITFGLGLWLSPGLPVKAAPVLQVALLAPERGMEHMAAPARSKQAKDQRPLELSIKNPRDLEEAIKKAKDTGDWPDPPRVDVDLVMKNAGKTPLELTIGGPDFLCVLDLSGPVVRQTLPPSAPLPFPPRTVTIPAGGSFTLHIERLASQIAGRVQNLYPTGTGDYTLQVRLDAVGHRQGARERIHLRAGPMPVRLR